MSELLLKRRQALCGPYISSAISAIGCYYLRVTGIDVEAQALAEGHTRVQREHSLRSGAQRVDVQLGYLLHIDRQLR